MNTEEVLSVFREAGAVLEGHFILTSGLHSPTFLQKARVFMQPAATEKLCKGMAEAIEKADLGPIDYVVGPAIGGLIPAYFEIAKGARCVIVEDIVTTGLSIRETVDCLQKCGAEVLAATCIIDRSAGKADVGVPLVALAEYEVPAYEADNLPPELAAIPAFKPGSRPNSGG